MRFLWTITENRRLFRPRKGWKRRKCLFIIYHLVQFYDCEIKSGVAKRIKEDYLLCKKKNENYYLNESVIKKYKREKSIKVSFSQDEIEKFFNGIPKHSLKEYIISIAKNTQDV